MFCYTQERGSPPKAGDVGLNIDDSAYGDRKGHEILREVDNRTDEKVCLILDYFISVVRGVDQRSC